MGKGKELEEEGGPSEGKVGKPGGQACYTIPQTSLEF